jgi:putative flippase GtrA
MKTGFYTSVWRSQISAGLATAVDFSTMLITVEILNLWYGLGVFLGAILGALTSFWLGRNWSFRATGERTQAQAFRYFWVSCGSLALNFFGVIFLTESFRLKYWLSKIVTVLVVGLFYNFVLHRYFVFRR